MNLYQRSRSLVLSILLIALLVSCAPSAGALPTQLPAQTAAPTATSTPAPLLTVKVVTYNILYGGGRDRANDERISDGYKGIDRTQQLIEYMAALNADVIGLQEATGWDTGDTPYIKTVAEQLDMNYFISTRPEADSALLTRYDILEAEELSNDYNSVIRARLRAPDGEPLNIFVTHLDSDSSNHRACGAETLLQKTAPYADERTLIIGDMNFRMDWGEWAPQALPAQGWRLMAVEGLIGIDHIWATPSMQWQVTDWSVPKVENLRRLSDHLPLGREIQIYSPSGEILPAPSATAMPPAAGLPSEVAGAFPDARVSFFAQSDSPCVPETWEAGWANESNTLGQLRLYGEPDWRASARWTETVPQNGGVMLDFKYTKGSEFNIFLDHDVWEQPNYRRFGLYVANNTLRSELWQGKTGLGGDIWNLPQSKADTWYRLLLAADKDARFRAWVWEIENPSNLTAFHQEMDADWKNLSWRLAVGANLGRVFIKNVVQLALDSSQ